jgi:hypothetical protein
MKERFRHCTILLRTEKVKKIVEITVQYIAPRKGLNIIFATTKSGGNAINSAQKL